MAVRVPDPLKGELEGLKIYIKNKKLKTPPLGGWGA
jgi:hypothetical protein